MIKQKIKTISIISFFILYNVFGQGDIQNDRIAQNQLQLENNKNKYNVTFEIIKDDTLVLTSKNEEAPLFFEEQKIITRDTFEKKIGNISKLSLIHYPGNLDCKNCEETISEIQENGVFTYKYESVFGGFDIIQGTLSASNLEYFKSLIIEASVHKYPKKDFSNGEKIIRKDLDQFYFLINTNNEIRKSLFVGMPPNGDKLIEFLLNIAEFDEWKKIDEYQFEIKTTVKNGYDK